MRTVLDRAMGDSAKSHQWKQVPSLHFMFYQRFYLSVPPPLTSIFRTSDLACLIHIEENANDLSVICLAELDRKLLIGDILISDCFL